MTNFESLLATLAQHKVAFIVVGGAAAIAHGSARLIQDLEIVYARSPENLHRLAAALAAYKPYLRGAPAGLPFTWDESTLARPQFHSRDFARRHRSSGRNSRRRRLRRPRGKCRGTGNFRHPLLLSEPAPAHPRQTRRGPPKRPGGTRRTRSNRRRKPVARP